MSEVLLTLRQPSLAELRLAHHWRFYVYRMSYFLIALLKRRLFVEVTFFTTTGPWLVKLAEITDFAIEEVLDQVTGKVQQVFFVVWNGKFFKLPNNPTNEANYQKWRAMPKNTP